MRKEVSFFNDIVQKYDTEYTRETPEGYSFRMRRERVLDLVPKEGTGKSVLDIACGPGIMVEGLHARGYATENIDAAPEMVELAAKKFGHVPNAHFAVGDVYALSQKDNSFDVVTAMGLVEYLDDQDRAMAEMARVAKLGGLVIVSFPNKPSFWRTWARVLRALTNYPRALYRKVVGKPEYPITHREYTESEARAYMSRHGLDPVDVMYYNFKITPFPLDKLFPRLTVHQSKLLEKPRGTGSTWMATAFIVAGVKK